MPYAKMSAIAGAYDSYEIVSVSIDINQRCVSIGMHVVNIDASGIPRTSTMHVTLRDENREIIDPAWDANSTPPKPAGFDPADANTWGGLTWDQLPKMTDQSQQHFTNLAASDPAGVGIYERLKNGLYAELATAGHIPSSAFGWGVV